MLRVVSLTVPTPRPSEKEVLRYMRAGKTCGENIEKLADEGIRRVCEAACCKVCYARLELNLLDEGNLMLGDILLIDYFVVGAILFGTGHVFFFLSFCMISGFSIRDLIIGAIIFVLAFLLIEFYSNFDFGGMKILVIIYALIISLMLGKALSNMFCKNNLLIYSVILLGAGLFFISDLMLMFYLFAGRAVVFDIICLATYYPAEFILALSIYLVSNKLMSTSSNFRK